MHCPLLCPDNRLHLVGRASMQPSCNVPAACIDQHVCGAAANGNSNGMPPPSARVKADDDDIFGDAGTDYVCELPKVRRWCVCVYAVLSHILLVLPCMLIWLTCMLDCQVSAFMYGCGSQLPYQTSHGRADFAQTTFHTCNEPIVVSGSQQGQQ